MSTASAAPTGPPAPAAAGGLSKAVREWWTNVRSGQLGSLPIIIGLVIISHNLHDIFEVADNITVLRLGQNVAEFKRTEVTEEQVVHAITAGKLTKVPGLVDTEVIA